MVRSKGEKEGGARLEHQPQIRKEMVKVAKAEAVAAIKGEGEVEGGVGFDHRLEKEETIKVVG